MRCRTRAPRPMALSTLCRGALIGLAILLVCFPGLTRHDALAQSPPSLHLVHAAGYALSIQGKGWPRGKSLAVTMYVGTMVEGLEAQTTGQGLVRIGVSSLDRCGQSVKIVVRDFARHMAAILAPALLCPPLSSPPTPTLHVLLGQEMQPLETPAVAPASPSSLTLVLGGLLYLWEPGTNQPAYSPTADERYLSLIGQGTSPAPGCTQSCDAGFYWEWIGIRKGHTPVDLSPACRQSTPPCALPDSLVDLHIVG